MNQPSPLQQALIGLLLLLSPAHAAAFQPAQQAVPPRGHGRAERLGSQPGDRYDEVLFVCRSIDPTGSRLNLRSTPRGRIIATISERQVFYSWGRDLKQTIHGYVAIRFDRPDVSSPPAELASGRRGWVWKRYITCEISN